MVAMAEGKRLGDLNAIVIDKKVMDKKTFDSLSTGDEANGPLIILYKESWAVDFIVIAFAAHGA